MNEWLKLVTVVVRKIIFTYKVKNFSEEDLVQEGMLALLKARNTFKEDGGAKFETYASRCIHNRVIDVIRRERGTDSLDFEISSQDDGVERELRDEILERVLTQLNEIERAIFNSYIQGYTYTEIAKIFEINNKKIDNTIQKVKIFVRKEI